MFKRWIKVWAVCILILSMAGAVVFAQEQISLAVNSSQVLNFAGVERVAVANPDIADVVVVSDNEVVLVGKSPGMTVMHVWSNEDRVTYMVEVTGSDALVAKEIKRILRLDDIQVEKVGKTVILEGRVKDNYQKQRAEKIASGYGEKVVNLLELAQPIQVKIEAKVIEVNRGKTKNLGIKWGNDPANPGTFRFGQSPMKEWTVTYPDGSGLPSGNAWNTALAHKKPYGRSWGSFGGYHNIDAELNALVQEGGAKILSQPNMVTVSGETANILVGGQIPVPVSQENGVVTVMWKDYGIKLDIAPEVNNDGLIYSKIKAEVSALDWTSTHQIGINAGMKIPPVTMRKAETAMVLSSGQTMAVGGLLYRSDSTSVTRVPLLGNLPLVGEAFTHRSRDKEETELIILVTPTIVDPENYVPKNALTAEYQKPEGQKDEQKK